MVAKRLRNPPCAVQRPPYTRRVDERSGRRLAKSTAIFSLTTGVSRVMGLIREMVASYYFGVGGKINAFTIAFQVPNLFRALVADFALSAAFIPVFTELLERGDRKRAWRVASSLFWLVLLVLVHRPWLRGLRGRLRVVIDWRDRDVWRVLRLMMPITLAHGLLNFNAVFVAIFASRLIDTKLPPTAIDTAFRLYMLPQQI